MELILPPAVAARRGLLILAAVRFWHWLAADWWAHVYVDSKVFVQSLSWQALTAHPFRIPMLFAALAWPALLSLAASHAKLVMLAALPGRPKGPVKTPK